MKKSILKIKLARQRRRKRANKKKLEKLLAEKKQLVNLHFRAKRNISRIEKQLAEQNEIKPTPPAPKPPKPAEPEKAEVIDVSMWQGDIDWKKVKASGISGVYLKLSEGQDFKDQSMNAARIKAIKEAGLDYGFYHFLRPRVRDAALEARWFIKCAKELGGWGTLIPVADIEVTTLDKDDTTTYLTRFLRVLRQEGPSKQTVVYASPGWWISHIDYEAEALASELKHSLAWVAHWGVQHPDKLRGISGVALHQYTDKGTVQGIKSFVDRNRTNDLAKLRRKDG